MDYPTYITEFEAPQANIRLDQPFSVQLAAHMAYLNPEALTLMHAPMELFEMVSHPFPYQVKMELAESAVLLDLTDADGHTVTCRASLRALRNAMDAYIKAEQKVELCHHMSADDATAALAEAKTTLAKGGYALMMAFRQEGLSMDPKTAEALFGTVAFTREQIIDRRAAREAPATSLARH